MSITLENEKAALAKDEGKVKKLFAAVKKFFAKEFLWLLFALLLALPIALIMTYIIETYVAADTRMKLIELSEGKTLFLSAYALSLAGIYFTRTVAAAIRTVVKKPTS